MRREQRKENDAFPLGRIANELQVAAAPSVSIQMPSSVCSASNTTGLSKRTIRAGRDHDLDHRPIDRPEEEMLGVLEELGDWIF